MNKTIEDKIKESISEFRIWKDTSNFKSCRLIQYCGIEKVGAIDVEPDDIERQIEGLISEGFHVAWNGYGGKLYLKVWEYDGPEPPWEKVFSEEDIENIEIPGGI